MPRTVIPLFPLNVVLFPGMALPLHIFEERYKQMIAWCQAQEQPFGVLLIREGEEVGSSARPYDVGTLARITDSRTLENGRLLIQTRGTKRFRIKELIHDKPYLQAEIEYLHDEPFATPGLQATCDEASRLFTSYLGLLSQLGGQIGDIDDLSLSPELLSWVIGSTLIAPSELRQELLEIEGTQQRLEREVKLLTQACKRLQLRIERKTKSRPYPFSLN
jgi:uncharacterized protein